MTHRHTLRFKRFSENNSTEVQEISSTDFIVSLTSYVPRFGHLEKVLLELNKQTTLPNLLVLNIATDDLVHLPPEISRIKLNFPVEINSTPDLGPGKKLIPTLVAHPERIIITIDDDILYPPALFENLLQESLSNPGSIICARGHIPRFDSYEPLPYLSWLLCSSSSKGEIFMPTSGGGVLFPPNSLHPDVSKSELYKQLSFTTDDLWYWVHAIRNSTGIVKSAYGYELIEVSGLRKVTLESGNMFILNNVALRSMWDEFQMTKILKEYVSVKNLRISGIDDMSEYDLFLNNLYLKFMQKDTLRIFQETPLEYRLTFARMCSNLQEEVVSMRLESRVIFTNATNIRKNLLRKIGKILPRKRIRSPRSNV